MRVTGQLLVPFEVAEFADVGGGQGSAMESKLEIAAFCPVKHPSLMSEEEQINFLNASLGPSQEYRGTFCKFPCQEQLHLPDEFIRIVRKAFAPGYFRDEGIKLFRPDEILSEKDTTDIQDFVGNDRGTQISAQRVHEVFGERPVFYCTTDALTHLFHRELGWIHPEDLGWLVMDCLQIDDGIDPSEDCGYYVHDDPRLCSYYGGTLSAEQPLNPRLRFLSGLGIDTASQLIRTLINTHLLLEIPFSCFEQRLFNGGTYVCAPQYTCEDLPESSGVELISSIAPLCLGTDQPKMLALLCHPKLLGSFFWTEKGNESENGGI